MSEPCDHEWVLDFKPDCSEEIHCALCQAPYDGPLMPTPRDEATGSKTFTREELETLALQVAALESLMDDYCRAAEGDPVEEIYAIESSQAEIRASIAETLGVPFPESADEEEGSIGGQDLKTFSGEIFYDDLSKK